MNPRWRVWLVAGLAAAVVAGAIYFPVLRRRIQRAARLQAQSIEQARRELLQPAAIAPGEPRVKAMLFWASPEEDGGLAGVTVELPLANEPVLRAKQVLNTLLAGPVDAELRTLPPDAALLEFYLLPDGTAIADFSEPLATSLPSGIESEKLAVESIARTLEANVPQVQRLKILIHGQEMETLAGHLDLTEPFVVKTGSSTAPAAPGTGPGAAKPTIVAPAATAAPAAGPPAKLTPGTAPGKLSPSEKKP
jgi:hypothetical protein